MEVGVMAPRVRPLKSLPPPANTTNSLATQTVLKRDGLPVDTLLGITSGGNVRHIAHTTGTVVDGALCNLFRPGTSLMRLALEDDEQKLCNSCLKTLEAEVMRAKEAMKGEGKS
jgi:hypothetical protein